jgi:hypothetical protein
LSTRFDLDKLGYFGPFSCNEQTDKSDIDTIGSFNKPIAWAFFDIQKLLGTALKRLIKVEKKKY